MELQSMNANQSHQSYSQQTQAIIKAKAILKRIGSFLKSSQISLYISLSLSATQIPKLHYSFLGNGSLCFLGKHTKD